MNRQLQQLSWPILEDLAFCSRTPQLAELAAQVLFEQQLMQPLPPVDPALPGRERWALVASGIHAARISPSPAPSPAGGASRRSSPGSGG